ncbi:MAG: CDP-alcohol phosphatidyltransferase family protein [Parachlamydiaceae bacterium]|nr:CDP-alcohol phosphatidyltransferase family protein [Parachlamydiaceae bacterium]
MEKQKIKKIYFLPNVITAFGLSCGLFVIFKMNMTEVGEVTPETLIAAAGILLLAAFADLLDGAVARVMKAESEFGGIFDSLADAISFGVAPSVIILKSLSLVPGTNISFLLTIAAIIFSLCGVLRLVRFNVNALAAKTNLDLALANKKNFTGLPIPAAAAAAVSINLFLFSNELKSIFLISDLARAWVLSLILIFLGYCMISRWKFPSVKSLEIRVASFQTVFLTVVCAVVIFFGILHHFPVIFFIIAWSYIIIALVLSIIRIVAGKKSKTLEDFEPEEEDEDLEE